MAPAFRGSVIKADGYPRRALIVVAPAPHRLEGLVLSKFTLSFRLSIMRQIAITTDAFLIMFCVASDQRANGKVISENIGSKRIMFYEQSHSVIEDRPLE
jgi:hypothetical protein